LSTQWKPEGNGGNAETLDLSGTTVVLRRAEGLLATELFFHCEPPVSAQDAGAQAEAIYRSVLKVLEAQGAPASSVVCETIFLRDPQANLAAIRAARDRILGGLAEPAPATLAIEQPPLRDSAHLEVSIQAVVPIDASVVRVPIAAARTCSCSECLRAHGVVVELGGEKRFQAAGLCGAGSDAYEQTHSMFADAEALLRSAGMEFTDVVRTWIHLREMERDYDSLNRARREFFEARQLEPIPASTGIGGGPVSQEHDLCLGIYAVKAGHPPLRTVMTSPTLNEAPSYGADFVRGMRSEEANKIALHVSGTASINERGASVHEGDFDAQAQRMLVNVEALLAGQGASFRDIVSGVTYVKHARDGDRLREIFDDAGFGGFPNALVNVEVCRPELLCETEVLAVLPK